jgi:hypothetical protein
MQMNDIATHIAALGPALDLLAIEAESDQPFWRIAADEDVLVYAEHDQARDVLMLYSEIGPPPEEGRLAFYELILRYQFAWDAFEGARLSLNEEKLWLIEGISATQIASGKLSDAFASYLRRHKEWRALASGFGKKAETAEKAAHPLPHATT